MNRQTRLIQYLQDELALPQDALSLATRFQDRTATQNSDHSVAVWPRQYRAIRPNLRLVGFCLSCPDQRPVCILIAIALKPSSPAPILFKQQPYGLNGSNIVDYKFRSLRVMENTALVSLQPPKRLLALLSFSENRSSKQTPALSLLPKMLTVQIALSSSNI